MNTGLIFRGKIIGHKAANRDYKDKQSGETKTIQQFAIGVAYQGIDEWGEIVSRSVRVLVPADKFNADLSNQITNFKGKFVELKLFTTVNFGEFKLDTRESILELAQQNVRAA